MRNNPPKRIPVMFRYAQNTMQAWFSTNGLDNCFVAGSATCEQSTSNFTGIDGRPDVVHQIVAPWNGCDILQEIGHCAYRKLRIAHGQVSFRMRTQPRRGDRVAGLYDLGRKLQNLLANGSRRRGAEPRTTRPTDEPFRGNNLIFHAARRS